MKQTQMVQASDEWVLGWNLIISIYTSHGVKEPTKLVCIEAYHVPTQKLALALIVGLNNVSLEGMTWVLKLISKIEHIK
jgi:hypothetical protein